MGGYLSHHEDEDDDEYSDSSIYETSAEASEDGEEEEVCVHSGVLDQDITMDAAVNETLTPAPRSINSVTLQEVLLIDDELDAYEKVAVLYLIYEDADKALAECQEVLRNDKHTALTFWAKHQPPQVLWQRKLFEAVCIVQNYKVLKKLGFQRQDLTLQFFPSHVFIAVNVEKWRKMVYFICEKLLEDETAVFLQLVMKDFKSKHLSFKHFNSLYLEMYFLHWEKSGYIKKDNLDNIYTILKEMEQIELCDVLKEYVIPTVQLPRKVSNNKIIDVAVTNPVKQDLLFSHILDDDLTINDLKCFENDQENGAMSMAGSEQSSHLESNLSLVTQDINDRYNINPKHPGVCLIINQEHFYRECEPKYQHLLPNPSDKLEARTGSVKDQIDLKNTFDKYNFKTIIENDKTHIEMIALIKKVVESVTEESSLFVCILTHGAKGIVYGVNSCKVEVEQIQKIMQNTNWKNLRGKPKVLILQSCQGTRCQRVPDENDDNMTLDGPSSSQAIPATVDFLTFWATVPGYGAIRHKTSGSWFIQSLCKKMRELGGSHHFENICTKIVREVSEKKWKQKAEDVAMVPYKVSTLTKDFFLPPINTA